jgi:hypothetical protein
MMEKKGKMPPFELLEKRTDEKRQGSYAGRIGGLLEGAES